MRSHAFIGSSASLEAPVAERTLGPILQGTDAVCHFRISTRNLGKATGFYSRVLGFRIVEDARPGNSASDGYVVMAASDRVFLTLQASDAATQASSWGFLVEDLDRVRETLWNLGVTVAAGDGASEAAARSHGRSLHVRDPDGHEIELLERSAG